MKDQSPEERQAVFLEVFAQEGSMGLAAQAARVPRPVIEAWYAEDPAFKTQYEAAHVAFREALLQEGVRRGLYKWNAAGKRYVETPKGRRVRTRGRG